MIESASLQRLISAVRARLQHFELIIHRVMDTEHEWWPFAFLKPEPDAFLSTARVAALSCLYGLPAGLLAVLIARAAGGASHTVPVPTLLAWVCVSFFMTYRFSFAVLWNRRAERLQRLGARRTAWRNNQMR
jgi:hypothetical protein